MWKNSDRSIWRNDCENCRETPRVIARDRSDYCGTREQRGMGSVARPAGASDGSKTQEDRIVNNQSSAADVFINFASNSVINVTNLGGFCDSQSIGSLNCHHTLAANKSEDLPNPDFKYVNLALAFNHVVDCGATKAEVIANNPDWYDIMDVSVVDGFNNKIEIDAAEHGKMPVKLGPPAGMTGNQQLFGVFPFACTQCAASHGRCG
jgi:hypothetical protein